MISIFQLLLRSLFGFSIWFHFSENGPITEFFEKFKKRVWGGKDKSHVLLHFKVTLRFNISQPRATIKILSILIFDSNI